MSAALDMPDVDNVPGVQSICTWLPRYYICTLPPADASPSITVLPPLRLSHSLLSNLMHTFQPLFTSRRFSVSMGRSR